MLKKPYPAERRMVPLTMIMTMPMQVSFLNGVMKSAPPKSRLFV